MRIIISPAKKMNVDLDSLPYESKPCFLPQAELLKKRLQQMGFCDLQKLWKCNKSIAKLNQERLCGMNLENNLTPAIFSYDGIQFKYMSPNVFEYRHFEYIREHLRILSGFYGLLRPFDGVVPYRLEMQAKLAIDGAKNLYNFWGDKIARCLESETDFILNLASEEYSKAVLAHIKPQTRYISCTFGERIDGRIIEKGTMCKMARGEMVRFLAERNITEPEKIKTFNLSGYRFNEALSTDKDFVFIKENLDSVSDSDSDSDSD